MRTRETITISLPSAMRKEVEKIRKAENRTMSELVRESLRHYLQRQAIARVDELLLEGLNSGEPVPVTKKWWRELKADIKKASRRRRA